MSDSRSHLHAVILAGGSGARFWPLSRELSPKQLLSIFGGISLITRAVRRIMPFTACDAVHVVTGENLFDELRNHLKAQPEFEPLAIDYIVEPVGRSTAAAIALAAAVLLRDDPDAVMIVLPSDHLLEDGEVWADTVRVAVALAETGYLTTIGLKPTRAETGYGYIHAGDPIPERPPAMPSAARSSSSSRSPTRPPRRRSWRRARTCGTRGCSWPARPSFCNSCAPPVPQRSRRIRRAAARSPTSRRRWPRCPDPTG